jgi:hypothetical protein
MDGVKGTLEITLRPKSLTLKLKTPRLRRIHALYKVIELVKRRGQD